MPDGQGIASVRNVWVVKKGLNMKEFLWSLIHSPKDWVIGGVMAFVIWAIADLLPVGDSRIRGLGRWVRNKISEQSVARLKKRIEELEKYKKNLDLMLNSDKALYLNTFRAIFGTLLFGCIGAILTTLRHSEMLAVARPESPGTLAMLDIAAIMMYAIGIAVALSSLTITVAEDNKQKLAAQSEKYGKEIENLKMILKSRLDKLNPPS
jgi:ABC-type Fe3+ transport system permease subunit